MATTTSNFSWPIPQSTDLVKDGATAIASLGSGIDTSMAELKGGTTGQILSKTSGTDMDFTWITPNPGDITGVTAGTGLTGGGTSGDVTVSIDPTYYLLANQTRRNPVLNSNFSVWQRGTSISLAASTAYTSGFTADRWQTATGANQATTISRQSTNDTTNLPNIQYCLRFQRNSGQTGTSVYALVQNFETINSIPFAGKTVTLSFYARAGANYSAASSVLNAQLISGTGTDQNAFAGYTGGANVISQNATLTTTWQRFSYSGTVSSSATELETQFNFTPVGTAGAADYYEITGVQLEIGSTATDYRANGATYQGELAACQRYYQVFNRDNMVTTGQAVTTAAATTGLQFFMEMRTAPTITLAAAGSGSGQMSFLTSSGNIPTTIGTIAAQNITKYGFRIDGGGFTSAFTAGYASLLWANSADVWKASAEL